MGWASGSTVANELWRGLRDLIHQGHQKKAARCIIEVLEGEDWDTQDESPELMEAAFGPEWWEVRP